MTYLSLLPPQLLLEVLLNWRPAVEKSVSRLLSTASEINVSPGIVHWQHLLVLMKRLLGRSSSTDWLLIWLDLLKTER